MPSLIVRNLDEAIIKAVKQRAVEHQRSTEAEHRAILAEALLKPPRKTFAEALANIPDTAPMPIFKELTTTPTPPLMYLIDTCHQ